MYQGQSSLGGITWAHNLGQGSGGGAVDLQLGTLTSGSACMTALLLVMRARAGVVVVKAKPYDYALPLK